MARRSKELPKADASDIGPELDPDVRDLIALIPTEIWPIGDVIIDTNNANIHDRKSIDSIRGSIAKFGQVEDLLVRKATSVLVAGEGRLIAMNELGWTHVKVKPLPIDATTAAMLSLALNQTAKHSQFDFESVARQLKGFREDGHDLSPLGWADYELDPLLNAIWKPPDLEPMPSTNGEKEKKGHPHAVIFSEEQWPVIMQAVGKIRISEDDGLMKESRAIELIVADYLSRN